MPMTLHHMGNIPSQRRYTDDIITDWIFFTLKSLIRLVKNGNMIDEATDADVNERWSVGNIEAVWNAWFHTVLFKSVNIGPFNDS